MSTPKELSQLASTLFLGGSAKYRLMQKYRPYICPYDALIEYVPQGSSMLDIGCGGGLFLGLLTGTNRIKHGHGFDSSEDAIETAKRMAAEAKTKGYTADLLFEARSADAEWPDSTYDVVSLIDVMHHVPPPAHQKVINNAIERIKPGGRFIYKDMCSRPFWMAFANRMHDLVLAKEWINYVNVSDVIEWGTSAGLRVAHQSRINQLWYGHELVVFERPETN